MTADPALINRADEDWQRFQQVTSMTNHWDRPGWTPGREAYFWYLTFDSPQLRDLAEQCQQQLQRDYLDPVPLGGLHLTLARIGWADQVTDDQLQAASNRAHELCRETVPFILSAGPLAGSSGAVRFSVTPWEPLTRLHHELSNPTAVAGRSAFRPHIGIAYCNQAVPAGPLIAAIRSLRRLAPVDVPVSYIDLVRLHREHRAYAWSLYDRIPLSRASG